MWCRKYGSVAGSSVVGGGSVVVAGMSMLGANPPTPLVQAVEGEREKGKCVQVKVKLYIGSGVLVVLSYSRT